MIVPKIKYGTSGIYRITNIVNGKIYIGSSVCLRMRLYQHKSMFVNNNHSNLHIRRAVDKYGIGNFKIDIVALCPPKYLIKLEQWFIDNLRPQYNKRKDAASNLGIKLNLTPESRHKMSMGRKGKLLTEDHKMIIRIANTKKHYSLETRKLMSEKSKGKPKSEESRKNMSKSKMGLIAGMKGLSHSEKTKMQISEKSKEYIKNNTEEFYKRYRKKEKFILNPLGEVVNFFNVGDLCNENNLSKSMVRRVMQGAYHSHKGWTKFNN